ncbi:hypothetical protein QEN42_09365, partial [Gordonia alkanivorans]|uniref:hypothetical protein n=1 Tax=Gordonia alkanivorans TaxID=84096 RepID=UPI00244C73C1
RRLLPAMSSSILPAQTLGQQSRTTTGPLRRAPLNAAIIDLLTATRLAPYLLESQGDEALALELYAWNAAMAAACMETLAYVEVMLRNAVDRELSIHAREATRKIPWFMIPSITGASQASITRSIDETRARLRGLSEHRDSRDQIIAGLSFGFWPQLFGPKHEDLWRAALNRALPGADRNLRKSVSAKLDRIRPFRNRLAHHDSLLTQDIMFHLQEMLTLVEWINPDARRWVEAHERVSAVYKKRPVTPLDTLVVPATNAWPLYLSLGIYICPPTRNFRPFEYLAFYTDGEVKPKVARLRHHRDNVEWSTAEAARLTALAGPTHKFDRQIGAAIAACRRDGWTEGRYQIFMLSKAEDPTTITLTAPIPHTQTGRGQGFVRRHRYISHHSLQTATTTDDLTQPPPEM